MIINNIWAVYLLCRWCGKRKWRYYFQSISSPVGGQRFSRPFFPPSSSSTSSSSSSAAAFLFLISGYQWKCTGCRVDGEEFRLKYDSDGGALPMSVYMLWLKYFSNPKFKRPNWSGNRLSRGPYFFFLFFFVMVKHIFITPHCNLFVYQHFNQRPWPLFCTEGLQKIHNRNRNITAVRKEIVISRSNFVHLNIYPVGSCNGFTHWLLLLVRLSPNISTKAFYECL